jgi:hypothetical protein
MKFISRCSSILGGRIFLGCFQGPGPIIFIDHRLLHSLLETHFMSLVVMVAADQIKVDIAVKLLPLPQPPVRARSDARTNPSAQRATQLRSVLARVYAVSIQNQITTTVP